MVLTFLGCGQPLAFGPDDPFPELLSELGYADANDVHAFEPSWPLWSDGLDKQRWIHLPEGTTIGADFSLPDGTLLIKTFTDGDRPIETRLLRTGDPLEFAAYLWEGDDARLLSLEEAVPIEGLDHEVPRLFDCRMCHEPAAGALGVNATQWSAETVHDLSKLFDGEPQLDPASGATTARSACRPASTSARTWRSRTPSTSPWRRRAAGCGSSPAIPSTASCTSRCPASTTTPSCARCRPWGSG
jgi:hypothetical protein